MRPKVLGEVPKTRRERRGNWEKFWSPTKMAWESPEHNDDGGRKIQVRPTEIGLGDGERSETARRRGKVLKKRERRKEETLYGHRPVGLVTRYERGGRVYGRLICGSITRGGEKGAHLR